MLKSMTGYGRGEYAANDRKFVVEIKSVNHRYNEMNIKLPRMMISFEDKIRKLLSKEISRGKTDVYINYFSYSSADQNIMVNQVLAKEYGKALQLLEEDFGLKAPDTLSLMAKFPDIITVEKVLTNEEDLWMALAPALKQALENFVAMREEEGGALKKDMCDKLALIRSLVGEIQSRAPEVAKEYEQKLFAKVSEMLASKDIDESRLIMEVMLFADKSCIDEELTRLSSHLVQMEEIFQSNLPSVGRKLDFLIQEMNREANTIASKSNDIAVTKHAVELKSEIEKLREQAQNIE